MAKDAKDNPEQNKIVAEQGSQEGGGEVQETTIEENAQGAYCDLSRDPVEAASIPKIYFRWIGYLAW